MNAATVNAASEATADALGTAGETHPTDKAHGGLALHHVIIPACVRGFDWPVAASDRQTFNVYTKNGYVSAITPSYLAINSEPNSLPSGMLIPAMVDLHVHLDKTYVVGEVGAADGDLFTAIDRMARHRAHWTTDQIAQRMARALQEAYQHGTRALRTHLDWPGPDAPRSLAAFEAQRDAWRGRVALQCVALTPLDLFAPSSPTPSNAPIGANTSDVETIAATLAQVNRRCQAKRGEAALLGAFVYRNDDLVAKLQRVFALAQRHGLSLDFHVDEGLDADACGLLAIAELTLQYGYQGRVTCGHACSLSVQTASVANDTLALCALAGIHLVALPSTNLYLQGAWDATPVERGITRLKEASRHSVSASLATDNVADAFFPYGSYDLLDNFCLGVQVAHLSPPDAWLTHITTHPARAMGLPWDGKIAVGCPADFIVLQATNGFELMTPAGRQRRVVRKGQFLPSP